MQTRSLGRTGLTISRVGLGLAALGRPGYINVGHSGDIPNKSEADMEQQAHAVLDAAWAAGIRYFDAARSYGKAEAFLASWLRSRQINPEAVVVGSKWGYTYTAAWKVQAEKHEVKQHSHSVLVQQLAESRGLLGLHLNLYQIHSATLESGVLDNRPALDELARLQSEGVKIGLSLTGSNQTETLRRALDVEVAGRRLFDCVQATWNLLEPSAGPVLREAHELGLGVIVKEALANGRLTTRNQEPAFASWRLLEQEASRLGTTIDALALSAVLSQPWVDVVLSGATTVEQLASNVAALEVTYDEQASRSLGGIAESPRDYWDRRSKLAWN